jgi:DNA polymerase-3 subunit alpha
MEVLEAHAEGLIGLSSCLKGEIAQHLLRNDDESARKVTESYCTIFGEGNFFLELQDHGMQSQKVVNDGIVGIGTAMGVPLVATNDVHFLNREDAEAHDVLLCIQTGKTVNDENRMRFDSDEIYFKSSEEMAEKFGDVPGALSNTVEIAERCNLELEFGKTHRSRKMVCRDDLVKLPGICRRDFNTNSVSSNRRVILDIS